MYVIFILSFAQYFANDQSPSFFQVSAELDLINEEAIATQSQAKVTPLDMFGPDLRWPLLLAVFTMVGFTMRVPVLCSH